MVLCCLFKLCFIIFYHNLLVVGDNSVGGTENQKKKLNLMDDWNLIQSTFSDLYKSSLSCFFLFLANELPLTLVFMVYLPKLDIFCYFCLFGFSCNLTSRQTSCAIFSIQGFFINLEYIGFQSLFSYQRIYFSASCITCHWLRRKSGFPKKYDFSL